MKLLKSLMILTTAMVTVVASFAQVMADPLPGQILKFDQQPMVKTSIAGQVYYGHDEISTAYGTHGDPGGTNQGEYIGNFMADDFADKFDTPVVHIRWWGSYPQQTDPNGPKVQRFLISFEEDVPNDASNPLGFSYPGQPLLNQISERDADGILTPSSGTFTEKLIHPGDPLLIEPLYEYNAELACPFEQEPDTVYWLKIVALVDESKDGFMRWGWHNRDYTKMDPLASVPPAVIPGEASVGSLPDGKPIWHFQDDAVSGIIDPIQVFNQCNVQFDQHANSFKPEKYLDGTDGPGPTAVPGFNGIGVYSKDLAFELYTIPEPSTFILLLIAAVSLCGYSRRIHRR